MKGQGYGRIINMTSIMSHVALAGQDGLCREQGQPPRLHQGARLGTGSRENHRQRHQPGPVRHGDEQADHGKSEANQQFISKIPLGRWGKLEEVGQLAVYLCSEEAGFITGTDVVIDGGWTAQ